MKKQNIRLPQPVVIKIENTEDWRDELWSGEKALFKKAYSVYLYDENLIWHLCSVTKDYELTHLYNYFEITKDFDELTNEEQEFLFNLEKTELEESVRYCSCSWIDSLPEENKERYPQPSQDDFDEEDWQSIANSKSSVYREFMEDVVENEQGNPTWC
jgi:hypothetical protein